MPKEGGLAVGDHFTKAPLVDPLMQAQRVALTAV
jgi:hypothetical protein